jgi:predicted nucleic acid-binding protein
MIIKPSVKLAMLMIDTSVWINVFRDRTGVVKTALAELIDGRDYGLSRFTQTELLQGSRDEQEWSLLSEYLAGQQYLDMLQDDWVSAGRIFYDLRRRGITVRSTIDCCIAQLAIAHGAWLIHDDHDFEVIAQVRKLRHIRFQPQ